MVVEHIVVRHDQNVPHQSVYLQPYLSTQEGIIFLNTKDKLSNQFNSFDKFNYTPKIIEDLFSLNPIKDGLNLTMRMFGQKIGLFLTARGVDRLTIPSYCQEPRVSRPGRAVRLLVAVLAAAALLAGPGAPAQPPRRPPLLAAQAPDRVSAADPLLLAREVREPPADREPPLANHGGGHSVLHWPRCVTLTAH